MGHSRYEVLILFTMCEVLTQHEQIPLLGGVGVVNAGCLNHAFTCWLMVYELWRASYYVYTANSRRM